MSGNLYVPQTPETYSYDVDGNLLSDGRWTYAWDGENRLTVMTSLTNAPSGSQLQLAFTYNYQGRRIQKIVATNNAGSYVGEYTNNYAYDGWNCLAILNFASLVNSFMWGSDLSGSQQGAGGVGGLIEVTYYGAATTNCFMAFDGNGNASALVNAANGMTLANYEYGPFGELIRATGPMAKVNPFRFSTKYDDDESDFLYYGSRYYNPSTGRWPNRDPIGEKGGVNLFEYVGNEPTIGFDPFGLAWGDKACFDAEIKAAEALSAAAAHPTTQTTEAAAAAVAAEWQACKGTPPPRPPTPPSCPPPSPNLNCWPSTPTFGAGNIAAVEKYRACSACCAIRFGNSPASGNAASDQFAQCQAICAQQYALQGQGGTTPKPGQPPLQGGPILDGPILQTPK